MHQVIKKELHGLSNPQNAQKQAAYLRDQFPFLGIVKPLVNEKARTHSAQKKWTKGELLPQLDQIWRESEREFQWAALVIAEKFHKFWEASDLSLFESWIRDKSWWDTVDTLAVDLVGKLVLKNPALLTKMDQWIEDPHMWIRRTAIIFQIKWKAKTDKQRLFDYCLKCSSEKEFFIRKAIGWALREYSKTNPEAVRDFAEQYKPQLSGLSYREATRLFLNLPQR